jgi:hypothetical protein
VRFGVWNVRNLCRLGSLAAVARELAMYKLDLVGVQEVRWNKAGTVKANLQMPSRAHAVPMLFPCHAVPR